MTAAGSTEVGEYVYSVLGSRIQSEIEQTTTLKMFYDGADCAGDYDGTTTRWYVTPMLDQNLIVNDGSDYYYYTQDGLGSVRELIDTDQDTQNTYDYEAFGSFYGTPTESIDNTFTYTGRKWDAESQTYYHRVRQNFPTLGRFGSRDPIESINLYTYAAVNPVIYTDPFGQACATTEYLPWPCVAFKEEYACCCCAEDLVLENMERKNFQNPPARGHTFDVKAKLRFVAYAGKQDKFCGLEWWEKASWWPEEAKKLFPQLKDKQWIDWYEAFEVNPKYSSPIFEREWNVWRDKAKQNRIRPYCHWNLSTTKQITMKDRPSIGINETKPRFLEFVITIKSTPDCDCAKTSISIVFRQVLDPATWDNYPNAGWILREGGVSVWPPTPKKPWKPTLPPWWKKP